MTKRIFVGFPDSSLTSCLSPQLTGIRTEFPQMNVASFAV